MRLGLSRKFSTLNGYQYGGSEKEKWKMLSVYGLHESKQSLSKRPLLGVEN